MRAISPLSAAVLIAAAIPAFAGNPERDAYFGETHVHTSWSLDAFAIGNVLTNPGDAYKYFKGEPIKHPLGYDVKIDTPLDWAGVTDHSEYAGVINLANEPGSPVSKIPQAEPLVLKARTKEEMERVALYAINTLVAGPPVKALMQPEIAGTVWKRNVALAEQANEPGKFTAFCSYEWTSMPNNMNLHRNVFFKDCAKVPPMPFSALDSPFPDELWKWMDGQRKSGNELLAISHNANLSDGRMYSTDVDEHGRPIDAAYAASRDRNERLIEMKQLKGTSETHPLLSPTDEFASFEIMSVLLGNPPGRIPHIVGSYARQALKDGLAMQDTEGFNPYKFGFGAGSDSHNTAVPYRQDNFFGGHSFTDGTIEARMSGTLVGGMFDARTEGTGGLTGVWAEENTRASIFEAMQRKETFAVSGPHIKVRFFGGWEYTADAPAAPDWVKTGYAKGVPMGGDLPPAKAKRRRSCLGGEGPDLGQSRPHPDGQGLDAERPELREGLRRRLGGRPQAGQVDGADPADREHGRPREGDVHEHDRLGGAEDRVDGSRVRSVATRLLLRPRAGDPDASVDHHPGREAGGCAARRRRTDAPGARVELADLVHAERRGAAERQGRHHGGRPQEAGRRGGRRRGAEEARHREVGVAREQGHGREVRDRLRCVGQGRGREAAAPRRARLRCAEVRREPG